MMFHKLISDSFYVAPLRKPAKIFQLKSSMVAESHSWIQDNENVARSAPDC